MMALLEIRRAMTRKSGRQIARIFGASASLILLAACGGGDDAAPADAGNTSASAAAPAAGAASSFKATATGAVSRTVETGNAFSEAKYGRYHINLASHDQPTMVVAFGRTDQSTPSVGSYQMDGDGFSGTVEIYSDPQLEFNIVSGVLEITDARGDALAGRFSIRAVELGGSAGDLQIEGTFQTGKKD